MTKCKMNILPDLPTCDNGVLRNRKPVEKAEIEYWRVDPIVPTHLEERKKLVYVIGKSDRCLFYGDELDEEGKVLEKEELLIKNIRSYRRQRNTFF